MPDPISVRRAPPRLERHTPFHHPLEQRWNLRGELADAGGGAMNRRETIPCGLRPSKGTRPEGISYTTQARL